MLRVTTFIHRRITASISASTYKSIIPCCYNGQSRSDLNSRLSRSAPRPYSASTLIACFHLPRLSENDSLCVLSSSTLFCIVAIINSLDASVNRFLQKIYKYFFADSKLLRFYFASVLPNFSLEKYFFRSKKWYNNKRLDEII